MKRSEEKNINKGCDDGVLKKYRSNSYRKESGFTLIELLAVIVILAVIALIATPLIMNVINEAKKGASKDSMYAYVKGVELSLTRKLDPKNNILSGNYIVKDGNLYDNDTKIVDVAMKGSKPENGCGYVTVTKGNVTKAELKFDGSIITYENGKVAVKDSDECGLPSTGGDDQVSYTVGDEVYFDPTGTILDCKSGKEWTPSNRGTTCYKWNVIKDNGNTVDMLLDHNTTATIAWISKDDFIAAGGSEEEYYNIGNGNTKYGPQTLTKQLKNDTMSWSKVETLTSSDNVTRFSINNVKYTINYNGMKARIISGQEVADMNGMTKWTPDTYEDKKLLKWFFTNSAHNAGEPDYDYTNHGYWTDTALSAERIDSAWGVYYSGYMDSGDDQVSGQDSFGIRPIARILKSNI